jgi:hypothetical protein
MQEQLNSVFQLTCCFLYLRKCYILYKKNVEEKIRNGTNSKQKQENKNNAFNLFTL